MEDQQVEELKDESKGDLKLLLELFGRLKRWFLYALIPSAALGVATAAWNGHRTIRELSVRMKDTETRLTDDRTRSDEKIRELAEAQKESVHRIEKKIDKIYDHLLR